MRNKQIDILKGIGAILVVIGHLVSATGKVKIWIYAFHMPLFFALSGFLFHTKKSFKEYLKNNIKTLIIPYFVFNIISLLFHADTIIQDKLTILQILDNIFYFHNTIMWNSSLWFFITLFFTRILYYGLNKLCNDSLSILSLFTGVILGIGIILNIFQIILPFGILIVPFALTFFHLGYVVKKKNILEKIKLNVKQIMLTIFLSCLFIVLSLLNQRVNMSTNIYNNYFLYFLNALLGIYICTIFSKFFINNKLLVIFANTSMVMFSTQRILYKIYPFDINKYNIFAIFLTLIIYILYYFVKEFLIKQKKKSLSIKI